MNRQAYAQESSLLMGHDADPGGPGAAITVALCGHWQHDPPCPLAPHFTSAEPDRDLVVVRTLFVTEPANEAEVRSRIESALAVGELTGTDSNARWQLLGSVATPVLAAETEHAERLKRS